MHTKGEDAMHRQSLNHNILAGPVTQLSPVSGELPQKVPPALLQSHAMSSIKEAFLLSERLNAL